MTEEYRDRLVKVETLLPQVEKVLEKISENLEVLPIIKLEVEQNKMFRDSFTKEVTKILHDRLNTITFEKDLTAHIEKNVMLILNREEVRESFTEKVIEIYNKDLEKASKDRIREVFSEEFKGKILWLYLKITGVISGIALTILTMYLQGMFNE